MEFVHWSRSSGTSAAEVQLSHRWVFDVESDASAVEHLAEMKAEQLKAQETLSGSSAFWETLLTADLTLDLQLGRVL